MHYKEMAGDPKQWMAWLPELMKTATTVPSELPADWVRDPQSIITHRLYGLVRATEQKTIGCVSWASKKERRAQGLWTPIIFQSPFKNDMCDGYLVRTPCSSTKWPKLGEKSKADKYNRRAEWIFASLMEYIANIPLAGLFGCCVRQTNDIIGTGRGSAC